jgi:uncharacterized protein (UPF0262 family)
MNDQPQDGDQRNRIVEINLDERSVVRRSPDVEHERAVAIYDLIEENFFAPAGYDQGPYNLHLSIAENRLLFDIRDEGDAPLTTISLPLMPFRRIVKDYFSICETYFEAMISTPRGGCLP